MLAVMTVVMMVETAETMVDMKVVALVAMTAV